MPHRLTWRRCTHCGQLTLVPVSANVCWQCGAPCPGGEPQDHGAEANPHDDQSPGRYPRPTSVEAWMVQLSDGAGLDIDSTTRVTPVTGLSAADDQVARRLLASVFPDGFEFE